MLQRIVSTFLLTGLLAGGALSIPAPASAVLLAGVEVPVPEPLNLSRFVTDKDAAIRLGKALYWDMQLGSDDLTACAPWPSRRFIRRTAAGPLRHTSGKWLSATYTGMIQAAFQPEWWNSPARIDGFSQMEQNFSLFFGLAVQLYEATLVADQSPFDRFSAGDATAMSESAQRGFNVFQSGGPACLNCHVGPELTGASVSGATAPGEAGLVELMAMGNGLLANYDIGFYNIGVSRISDDLGRGGSAPFTMANNQPMPLSFTGQHFAGAANLGFTPLATPGCINNFLAEPPTICPPSNDPITRQAVNGAFKTPGLRNVELTGPYMHDGSMVTLMQFVDFYTRGGNFHTENLAELDPFIDTIGQLVGDEDRQRELVDFLLSLTDERVRWEQAPFDHPQLLVSDGH